MQSDELCCSGWVWLSRQGTCQLSMLVRFGQHAVGCQGSRKLPERMVLGCEGLTPARDVLSVQIGEQMTAYMAVSFINLESSTVAGCVGLCFCDVLLR